MNCPAPRILIVRLSAIGDVLHSLPVACALREALPKAHLTWLVEGRATELLAGHPALDELITLPRRWLKNPRAVYQLWRRLHGRFDIALDVQGLSKSAIAARLSGAPRRIGFAPPQGREISSWLNNQLVQPIGVHVVDRYLELLLPLGIYGREPSFALPERAAEAQFADRLQSELLAGQPFALINPGAGWPSKLWAPDRFAAVARHLAEVHRLATLVVWAGPSEESWARQIVAEAPPAARLAPATTLCQLAAITRRATLCLSADTGPLHLAAAVGTPCVGLFGPMPAERNGPYGPGHVALQVVRLEGSSRERRTANNDSMLAIDVGRVTAACDELLRRRAERECA